MQPEHINDNEMKSFPSVEEMRQKRDEMKELFDAAREKIDAIIACIDEILLYEEERMCDEII